MGGGSVPAPRLVNLQKMVGDPPFSQAIAFKAEIGKLINGIEQPECPVEFKAVDDLKGNRKKDVFGAKVAMSFDDPPAFRPLPQQTALCFQESSLPDRSLVRPVGHSFGECGSGRDLVLFNILGKSAYVPVGRHRNGSTEAVKSR